MKKYLPASVRKYVPTGTSKPENIAIAIGAAGLAGYGIYRLIGYMKTREDVNYSLYYSDAKAEAEALARAIGTGYVFYDPYAWYSDDATAVKIVQESESIPALIFHYAENKYGSGRLPSDLQKRLSASNWQKIKAYFIPEKPKKLTSKKALPSNGIDRRYTGGNNTDHRYKR